MANPVSPSRAVAAGVLLDLEQDTSSDSGELLDKRIEGKNLAPHDARLATALVFAVLRNQTLLDWQYRGFLKHPPERLRPAVRVIFRLAAAQRLLFERLPPHAIVNESVELARRQMRLARWETGFVNAIARKIVALDQIRLPEPEKSAQWLETRYSHPRWLIELLLAKYGPERLEAVLEAGNREPRATLRVNTLLADPQQAAEQLAGLGIPTLPGGLCPEALVLREAGTMRQALASPLFAQGALYAQDEASQLVAHLAAPRPGEKILDLCAAPGGKSTHLAQLARGQARIFATDVSAARLDVLRTNAARMRMPQIQTLPFEALGELVGERTCDLALVDAPCSGLGTLRRNPEIRYRCSPRAIERLAAQQLEILLLASRYVAPGGRLLYSTCTVSDAENRRTIDAFLERRPGWRIEREPCALKSAQALLEPDGFYRTWPAHLEMDGFEAVLLRNNACPAREEASSIEIK